jgi:hypothetical protein
VDTCSLNWCGCGRGPARGRCASARPLIAHKDFERTNLHKDLVLTQLRAESAIKTAVNSINGRKVMPLRAT